MVILSLMSGGPVSWIISRALDRPIMSGMCRQNMRIIVGCSTAIVALYALCVEYGLCRIRADTACNY